MAEARNHDAQDVPESSGPTPTPPGESENTDDSTDGPPASVLEPGVSRLAPRWWMKTLAFAVVLIGFGAWGLYDALVAYPERGIADAEHKQLEYLRAWATSGRLGQATIPDPEAELIRLTELTRQPNRMSQADPMRLAWLQSLQKVARLTPEHTRLENPMERLRELENAWTSKNPPKPLSAYDIPAQWLFVLAGFTLGPWLLLKFITVARKVYHWDPDGQKLSLPGGHTITPADLQDIDKRKWDKFIVFLKIRDSHPTLAGQEAKIDLYHYTQPVEDWVLAMEQTAFPDRAEEDHTEDQAPGDAPSDTPPDSN